jgi:hypothetical protein
VSEVRSKIDSALKAIMKQFSKLIPGQDELKMDTNTGQEELKNDTRAGHKKN